MAINKIGDFSKELVDIIKGNDLSKAISTLQAAQKNPSGSAIKDWMTRVGNFYYDSKSEPFANVVLGRILFYDKNDILSVSAVDDCIGIFLGNNLAANRLELYAKYHNLNIATELSGIGKLPLDNSEASKDKIRGSFNGTWMYIPESTGGVSPYYNDAVSERYIFWILKRLQLIQKYYSTTPKPSESVSAYLAKEEVKVATEQEEERTGDVSSPEATTYLNTLLNKIYKNDQNLVFLIEEDLIKRAFKTSSSTVDRGQVVDQNRKSGFWKVFSPLSPNTAVEKLTREQLDKIFDKLESSGLLALASFANEITDFAKVRLNRLGNKNIQIADLIKDGLSTDWLEQLTTTTTYLTRDPILLSIINIYFPSLVTFYFEALSIATDYSNNGQGGGTDDEVNQPETFISSLEQAFGTVDGKTIFEHASRFNNTQKRIEEVLKNSPYRANIAPESPDIFHLRLGAANFFVPPLSIDVNTSFRTGSLTGAALRQKNTPKFNSGYKETTISMRLFFPNYEEIWGITIDDASEIVLRDNFEIDFKKGSKTSEAKIDKFLSSLRGLVAAFKYSPFLPVRNYYLNSVHGITGVALSNMSISTIPNYPFALAVDIELLNFNHKPLMPMISDFNQAIHWGKYRQYMGKAAGALHNYVNGSFLMKNTDTKTSSGSTDTSVTNSPNTKKQDIPASLNDFKGTVYAAYENDVFRTNVISEWINGNNLSFYIPAETQTKIFLPDITSFRSDQEKELKDSGSDGFWESTLRYFGIADISDANSYGIKLSNVYALASSGNIPTRAKNAVKLAIDILTAGINTEDTKKKVYQYLQAIFIKENPGLSSAEKKYIENYDEKTSPTTIATTWTLNGQKVENATLANMKAMMIRNASSSSNYLDVLTKQLADKIAKQQGVKVPATVSANKDPKYTAIYNQAKKEIKEAFNVSILDRFYKSGPIQDLIQNAYARSGSFQFNEWEVPMIKVDLNPEEVTINSVSVTMGNALAKLQVQMQDEPTYQHIGGKDTYINISMTIVGEKELMKLKRIFDHINSLARLEHATGVLGFMGIKNVITALSGVKYVMPLNYSVNTTPNYPHVYQVQLSLLDFDIFQQTREKLDSTQEKALIDHFQTKKNPFLRIKQMWGAFNAYPDFPLQVKNDKNEVVGHLDPDFYFRSFQMFDDDVIYNISQPTGKMPEFLDNEDVSSLISRLSDELPEKMRPGAAGSAAPIIDLVTTWMREYSGLKKVEDKKKKIKSIVDDLKSKGISMSVFLQILQALSNNVDLVDSSKTKFNTNQRTMLILDFIEYSEEKAVSGDAATFTNKVYSAPYKVGDISSADTELYMQLSQALAGEYSLTDEDYVSFDPDSITAHCIISMMPIRDPQQPNKIPAIMRTAYGTNFGYIDTDKDGRFYLTVGGANVKKTDKKVKPQPITDPSRPEYGATKPTTFPGAAPFSDYQQSISQGAGNLPETMSNGMPKANSVAGHWEKMLVDTNYRDVSGRMIRAFPTYMLWLIDEGGYFAGVKMFDNFYGLQSIIDFSVVSSEDLLGDTLVFRVSNLYSKLTKKESDKIFGPESDGYNQDNPGLTEGLSSIIDNTLNKAKFILSHMKSEYVVDIKNIRLKPGVRVHLRGGYGSNPNALQTLFNGTITEVQAGDIITVTAQSDAIELGATINTTNKKGDSGKIDGGINTGLWLSEPRDLMVRLLSMGTSRFREGIAYATQGLVFSENKFGIRHFGSILYEPMNEQEQARHQSRIDAISDAHNIAARMDLGQAASSAASVVGKSAVFAIPDILNIGSTQGFRSPVFNLMSQMWSNFSGQRDLEIFKRNIYPGNGTGIAQFLGGDLGDGWTSVSSVTPENQPNDRLEYLGRLTDVSWNNLVANQSNNPNYNQKRTYEDMTAGSELLASGSARLASNLLTAGIGAAIAPALSVTGGFALGAGLTGVLSGRGGTNIFRSIGLVSANDDDDMPGFDEVSFRAQTYMRTVWDLFQTCAKLLPNYIVAVRPFEDRSTVFYGKPHWLYTSGVVPVTTGYPGDVKAAELGIIPPQMRQPDTELIDIINKISKESTPYADASAFLAGNEPIDAVQSLAQAQLSGEDIFKTATYLKGKIIDFNSPFAQEVKDEYGSIIAKMPAKDGYVIAGYHLPVGGYEQRVIYDGDIAKVHKQIGQLPPSFSFPFFVDVKDDEEYLDSFSYTTDFLSKDESLGIHDKSSKYYFSIELSKAVEKTISEKIKNKELSSNRETIKELLNNTITFTESITQVASQPGLAGTVITVRMPYPEELKTETQFKNLWDGRDDQPYSKRSIAVEYKNPKIQYKQDWGFPATAEEEQFYIAMRWPYNPSFADGTSQGDEALSLWKDTYFDQKQGQQLYGTAQNYKDQHVMVYRHDGNNGKPIAVVCKPAYFLWGDDRYSTDFANPGYESSIEAVVSPDAAFYLGLMIDSVNGTYLPYTNKIKDNIDVPDTDSLAKLVRFAFVPNTVPLGVATTNEIPMTAMIATPEDQTNADIYAGRNGTIGDGAYAPTKIGFGKFNPGTNVDINKAYLKTGNVTNVLDEYITNSKLESVDYQYGGNYKGYLYNVINRTFDKVTRTAGYNELDLELTTIGDTKGTGRTRFADVFSITDSISIEARRYYDEDYDPQVSVIAGNGRTLTQARQIWDQFRYGYHTYDHVKLAFYDAYGMDPDSEDELPTDIKNLLFNIGDVNSIDIFKKFSDTGQPNGLDEFSILLGQDWYSDPSNAKAKAGADYAVEKFIDADIKNGGVVEYFNELSRSKLKNFYANFITGNAEMLGTFATSESGGPGVNPSAGNFKMWDEYYVQLALYNKGKRSTAPTPPTGQTTSSQSVDISTYIKTPKQLFLVLVGLFRQQMWDNAYSRAWLVLKPNRKMSGSVTEEEGIWDFSPITKIFAAYINPNNTYGKDKQKFLELLFKNRGEGSSATNIIAKALGGVDGFLDRTIGPIITAAGDALSSLVNMFKLNMLQMGYGLSQIGTFAKQANILNKVLNDSIYYAMGRPGSLLRAVDNPFTREYGEPVVEVREPFQRIHYLSSFSHILTNQIQETISGVSTVVTAVSDGKYPVTVALDKGAPADRQVEMTVETGIYFDNVTGSGFFGFLHPLLHPFETGRGISKAATGAPDELSAKRIALGYLKESVKDIYSGELLVLGNGDIRPHDLVFLADVYERMYGLFEVEQVIHHFTPELGYVTAITPNALVSVNDPARWYMTSWVHSWLSVQNIRNDTRIYLDALRAGNTGTAMSNQISVDALAENLSPQMIGSMQYTHGSSALIKDIVASSTAENFPDIGSAVQEQASKNGNNGVVGAGAVVAGITASAVPVLGHLAWKGWQWVRDNLMDQHGCYVQYLNKNGQPMDGGLSYNQGMVVGRYHSKALLPGVLGSRVNQRTPEGYSYIRTDDIFKNLGWKETEISTFVRYAGYENALVHAQVLGLSGLGPEKAGLEPMFKVICELDEAYGQGNSGVLDADTIQVKDILTGSSFRIRFDGINAKEKAEVTSSYGPKRGKILSYKQGFRDADPNKELIIFKVEPSKDTNSTIVPDLNLIRGEKIKVAGVSSSIDGEYNVGYVGSDSFVVESKTSIIKSGKITSYTEKYKNSNVGIKVVVLKVTPDQGQTLNILPGKKITITGIPGSINGDSIVGFVGQDYIVINADNSTGTYTDLSDYDENDYSTITTNSSTTGRYSDRTSLVNFNELDWTLSPEIVLNLEKATYSNIPTNNLAEIIPLAGLGNKATVFTQAALKNKLFVVRIAKSRTTDGFASDLEYEAGQQANKESNYLKELYGRTLGTIFYKVQDSKSTKYQELVYNWLLNRTDNSGNLDTDKLKVDVSNSLQSVVFQNSSTNGTSSRFNTILNSIQNKDITNHAARYSSNENLKVARTAKLFSALVEIKILDEIYINAAKWPFTLWDEFYEDGTPVTLNWELVGKGFADVFTNDLLNASSSVQTGTGQQTTYNKAGS